VAEGQALGLDGGRRRGGLHHVADRERRLQGSSRLDHALEVDARDVVAHHVEIVPVASPRARDDQAGVPCRDLQTRRHAGGKLLRDVPQHLQDHDLPAGPRRLLRLRRSGHVQPPSQPVATDHHHRLSHTAHLDSHPPT